MRLLGLWLGLLGAVLPAAALEAGAAKVDITPPLGTPLNGYGDRMSRGATGVHDPLWARCVYVSDGETAIFWVTTDLCIMNRELRAAVLERAPQVVPPEHVILTATHNHNGTGGMVPSVLWRSISGRFVPEVLASTAERIAEAMQSAYDNRERATLGFGTGKQTVLTTNRAEEDGPIDEQIGVIRIDDADGIPIAILANFAAHPTTVFDDDHYLFSADYPAYYYEELEALAGEGCIALFTNGAEGDQRTTNPENSPTAWGRTETVGRLLAGRVKEIANGITCDEVTLRVASAQPALPPTIAEDWMPGDVFLQTLEIGDALLVTFFPGEPCVDLGLEMRRRALATGYKAQFSVGLANEHLLYFVPRRYYAEPYYETAMNVFGPGIGDWFYAEFGRLMSRAPEAIEPLTPELPPVQEGDGVARVTFTGSPYAIGFTRGQLFSKAYADAFETYVRTPMEDRIWFDESSGWRSWPAFMDVSTVSVPMLAISARPGLKAINDDYFSEMEGIAAGAAMAFDAIWLTQASQTLGARGDLGDALALPFCTVFTVRESAGAAPLIGRTLDWPLDERPFVFEVRPQDKRAFLQVGFPWSTGVFTGVNDAGLSVAAERFETLGAPALTGPYLEYELRRILEEEETKDAAVAALQALEGLTGYAVTVADPAGAAVVTFSEVVSVRSLEDSPLLGADPASPIIDGETANRYGRVAYLLEDLPEVNAENLAAVLSDTRGDTGIRSAILNEHTRFTAVLDPAARTIHVRLPDGEGGLRDGGSFSLKPGAPVTPAAETAVQP